MPTKHEIIRERKLRQKIQRVVDENTPKTQDKRGFKYARCPLCGERYVINNNARREIRVNRLLGVAICPHCFYRRGTERLVRIYKLGKRLADVGELDEDGVLTIHTESVGDLIREAKELFK